ncbi:hypothetical protein JCGZ_17745 [Jatropha curcas]|uniref:Peroxisomal membrane protein PEX14 n=1 Tax=Jatropha curcas TaxID=180498 RepID=A0A067JRR3_JATCU|nr:peroxisomal membrane protein PEX14 isoform X2 [Jatropha curcas]KDP26587.1 hypothetical protein JCGZ_17745 [Jatropha curcas]
MGIEDIDSSKFSNTKPQSQGLDKEMDKDGQNLRELPVESMREELIQMAVKFLSHPSVSGSPITQRRSFLQKKGLTDQEIDEAFHRVPDATIGQGHTLNQDAHSKLVAEVQLQPTAQSLQPPPVASNSVISRPPIALPYRFYWSHFLVALGVLAASGVGTVVFVKKFILPSLKIWILKAVFEEHDNGTRKSEGLHEATEAAKVAATAASDVTKTIQAMLNSNNEEKSYFKALAKHLDIQAAEIKSMSNAIWKLEGAREAALSSKKHQAQHASKNVRPSSAPASVRPYVVQHPESFFEEINGSHPNVTQPLPNPWLAPRKKPWEVAKAQNNSQVHNEGSKMQVSGFASQLNGDNSVPWWRGNVKVTKLGSDNAMRNWPPNNSRITELKPENRSVTSSYNRMHDN